VLGSALFTCAILTLCVLPKHATVPDASDNQGSMLKVLQIPGVLVCTFGICATSASIGFISATLEPHLRQFNLSAVMVGVMFIINGGIYALCAPLVGMIVDRCKTPKIASIFGSICIIIGFSLIGEFDFIFQFQLYSNKKNSFLGPAYFIPHKTTISMVVCGLIFHGMGIGLLLVSTFSDALKTAIENGFSEGLETYGLVSGLWTSIFAFGAFVGPSVSGALYDAIGFQKSVYFIIILHAIVAVVFILFLCCSNKRPNMYKEISPNESIVKKSREDMIRSSNTLEGSRSRNSSFNSQVPIPIERGCAMNNLIMASSYGNKGNHWQRLEEANMGLLQDSNRDDISAYGSFDIDYDPYRETIA
jgi:MFS family permease